MPENPKTKPTKNRTNAKNLRAAKKELAGDEMKKVKGGNTGTYSFNVGPSIQDYTGNVLGKKK